MAKCQMDDYESSESYISIGTDNEAEPRFIVRFYKNIVEIRISLTNINGIYGEKIQNGNYTIKDTVHLINNTEWFEFYVEWSREDGYLRVGGGWILGMNLWKTIDFYELYSEKGVIINTIGVMHSSPIKYNQDWNIITFQFIPTNEPKLCWTSELEDVAIRSWVNTEIDTLWLKDKKFPTPRIPTALSTSLIFNGPFLSGNTISKTLTSIYEHDYILLQTRIYGFGEWDVLYPVWLNGLTISFNQDDDKSLIWFGTFLNDGGATKLQCDISEYKQWFNWKQPTTLNGLPVDILTNMTCIYDVNLYFQHNSINEPFSLSFEGDLEQSRCNDSPQFGIKLDALTGTIMKGYPKLLNVTLNQSNHEYCHAFCNYNDLCQAWMYNISGYCWLLTTSNSNIIREGGYISGICDGENIFDTNSSCSNGDTFINELYKVDLSDYLGKYTLIDYVKLDIECAFDNQLSISTSNDKGKMYNDSTILQDPAKIEIKDVTYTSRIQFKVSNNGFDPSPTKISIASSANLYQRIRQCDFDLYATNHQNAATVKQVEEFEFIRHKPGLNGDSDSISFESINFRGYYISIDTAENFTQLAIIQNDSTPEFYNASSFKQVAALNGNENQVSLIAYGQYEGWYITANGELLGACADDYHSPDSDVELVEFPVNNDAASWQFVSTQYSGFQNGQYPDFFINQCGSNLYMANITKENTPNISHYQWQMESPGLTGEAGTISIKGMDDNGNSKYISVNNGNFRNIEGSRLRLRLDPGTIKLICAADNIVNISYAADGVNFHRIAGPIDYPNTSSFVEIEGVTNASRLQFSVLNVASTVPSNPAGLKCSIYSDQSVVSTSDDEEFWSIISGNETIEEVSYLGWITAIPNYWHVMMVIHNQYGFGMTIMLLIQQQIIGIIKQYLIMLLGSYLNLIFTMYSFKNII